MCGGNCNFYMFCAIKTYNGGKCPQELKLWLKRRLSRKNEFDCTYVLGNQKYGFRKFIGEYSYLINVCMMWSVVIAER